MSLLELKSNVKQKRIRRGRGDASGHGSFSGRGVKGQGSRNGGTRRPGFEGGQTPLSRKMPKLRGFTSPFRVEYQVVNVGQLNIFENNTKVDIATLYANKLIAKLSKPVKLLSEGTLEKTLEITVDKASVNALKKVEDLKGKVTLLYKKVEKVAKVRKAKK
jgi:large subunit ribosomal protein L15